MVTTISKTIRFCSSAALIFAASQAFSFDVKNGHVILEGGWHFSTQGQAQTINIQTLIGDHYNVTSRSDNAGLLGIGYLLDGYQRDLFSLAYGVNAFYLAKTSVKGTITQEFLYTNLAYRYSMIHVPVYATVKANVNNHSDKFAVTLDAGVGPNFMTSTHFNDWSIDGGFTFPDHAYIGHSSTTFSATGGIGLKVNNVFGQIPVEVGYRFFYLGRDHLQRRTNQLINTLKTGDNYTQAVVVTVTL